MSEIQKPKFLEPCNHCGLCCRVEVCRIALKLDPQATAPCRFLTQTDAGSMCGVVLAEKEEGLPRKVHFALGIGTGCSMTDEDGATEWEAWLFDLESLEKVRRLYPEAI